MTASYCSMPMEKKMFSNAWDTYCSESHCLHYHKGRCHFDGYCARKSYRA